MCTASWTMLHDAVGQCGSLPTRCIAVESAGTRRQRDDQVAERVVRLEPAARADADQLLAAELDQLLEDDRRAGAAHPRSLHRHRLAVVGAGVAEQAALAVALHDVVEVGLGDVLRAQRVAGKQHRLGVVARLGADVDRHGGGLYTMREDCADAEVIEPTLDAGARVLRARARSSGCSSRTSPGAASGGSPRSRTSGGELVALCHVGANLVPSGRGCGAFARRRPSAAARGWSSARSRRSDALWEAAAARMPRRARTVRASPSTRSPSRRRPGDTGLRAATRDDLDRLLPACAAAHARGARRRPARARPRRLSLAHARRRSTKAGRGCGSRTT